MFDWFTLIYVLGIILCALIRIYYYYPDHYKPVKTSYFDGSEYVLFVSLFIFGIVGPIYAQIYLSSWDYSVSFWLKIVGVALLIATILLFWKTHKDLGNQFSPTLEIRDHHQLIDHGIYAYVRHPMYSLALLMILIYALLLHNTLGLISYTIASIILLIVRIPAEETMLLKTFGQKYKRYMRKTCGLIPGVCKIFNKDSVYDG